MEGEVIYHYVTPLPCPIFCKYFASSILGYEVIGYGNMGVTHHTLHKL